MATNLTGNGVNYVYSLPLKITFTSLVYYFIVWLLFVCEPFINDNTLKPIVQTLCDLFSLGLWGLCTIVYSFVMIILIMKINKKVTTTNMNYCLCCFAFTIWCICIWNVTSSLHTGASYLLLHSLLKSCKCSVHHKHNYTSYWNNKKKLVTVLLFMYVLLMALWYISEYILVT